ncbi:hypothetical protein SMALA_3446 [Streptomyces malaysiensis subsp. malaysiensis]|nr:hypothetical protein SMALA_3446 [Streptomyces malaysiensis]
MGVPDVRGASRALGLPGTPGVLGARGFGCAPAVLGVLGVPWTLGVLRPPGALPAPGVLPASGILRTASVCRPPGVPGILGVVWPPSAPRPPGVPRTRRVPRAPRVFRAGVARQQIPQGFVRAWVGCDREGLGGLLGESVEPLHGSYHRGAGAGPGGELGEVVRHRGEQIGAGAQQGGEGVVGPGAQFLGEGARHPAAAVAVAAVPWADGAWGGALWAAVPVAGVCGQVMPPGCASWSLRAFQPSRFHELLIRSTVPAGCGTQGMRRDSASAR